MRSLDEILAGLTIGTVTPEECNEILKELFPCTFGDTWQSNERLNEVSAEVFPKEESEVIDAEVIEG